ncbi:acyl dehydratase [Microvirga sp. HBU67558]|uniref:MaoC family dehydratase n=1 Tax=Microvirga TaxID=186650 RepID=UPI001B35AF6B|nr:MULTISPECIES: MaoC/PaaZ C-terminal domain-containing protein [unclassified Microvirga]MBQ0820691.1 acyl dehydratase [Microvirga sp. HBU67558]
MTASGQPLAPGEYWFEDLREGDRYETGRIVVTDAHIVGFAGLSGDFFDVHMDDEFARAQGFPARLAHGLLGLALVDGLKNRSSVRLMAIASLGWNWRFRAPILAGDRIGAKVRVAGTRLSRKEQAILTLAFEVTKQDGTIVQDGDTSLLMRRRQSNQGENT